VRRPFALIGASVALVFLAAAVDAVLWNYSLERDELRVRAVIAEQRVAELEARNLHDQIADLTGQVAELDRTIAAADDEADRAAAQADRDELERRLHVLQDRSAGVYRRPPCHRGWRHHTAADPPHPAPPAATVTTGVTGKRH